MRILDKYSPLILALILIIVVQFIPACSSLGLQTADTFNQKLAYAYGQVTAARKGALSVINAQCVDPKSQPCQAAVSDGKHIQTLADEARTGLDQAKTFAAAGNLTQANIQLQLESATLTALQTYLAAKGVK